MIRCIINHVLCSGKLDELSKLLGDGLLNDERLRSLIGENKAEAEKRMREKLALRKQRRDAGEFTMVISSCVRK